MKSFSIEQSADKVRQNTLTVSTLAHDTAFSTWVTKKTVENELRKAAQDATQLPRLSVLVVDDEPHIAITLTEILLRHGHLAIWFTDPLAALASMQRSRPGLLLTDFTMPGCNGFDLALEVKQLHPDCPVLILSAMANSPELADRVNAADLGIALQIKPLEVGYLLCIVAEMLFMKKTQLAFASRSRP